MMATNHHELLLTTETSGQLWGICAWDLVTGSAVRTFKGGSVAKGCLCVQAGQTVIGASATKPVLQLWGLTKKEDLQQKIVCPGKVSALAVSPNGLYCVASIAEKIFVWEMSTGNLLVVLGEHYLTVTAIRFTDDSNHFVTGGDDGIVVVWNLADVISTNASRSTAPIPRHKWSAHPLPVKDIYVGCGGCIARVVSCSVDHTCKMWDMNTGELVQTLVYEEEVHSVVMDKCELRLFAGLKSGDICCIPLYAWQWNKEQHVKRKTTNTEERVFSGHSGIITCMAVSFDGSLLVSGSADNKVKVWDIYSGSLNYTLDHKGHITNILLVMTGLTMSESSHQGPAIAFKHQPLEQQGIDGDKVLNIHIVDSSQWSSPELMLNLPEFLTSRMGIEDESVLRQEQDHSKEITSLQQEVAHLKQVNQDMYNFVAKKIVNT